MRFLTSDCAEGNQLLADLGKALLVLREVDQPVRQIVEHIWDIRYGKTHLAYEIERPGLGWQYSITLNPNHEGYALIERIEILLSAILEAEDCYDSSLGLGMKSVARPSERWRHLNILGPLENLRIARFEDRLRCAICHSLIASDSPIAETRFKARIHEQCNDFLHKVMIPALKAQRAAEAVKVNA